jgi:hypothetical protein
MTTGGLQFGIAACPAGKHILGGGANTFGSGSNVRLVKSAPGSEALPTYPANTTWIAQAETDLPTGAWGLQVFAVCAAI